MVYQTSTNQYQSSEYIVDPTSDESPYNTIQAALDAENAVGSGSEIYVRPGTYNENLTLYDGQVIKGATLETIIVGNHTPPASGISTLKDLYLIASSGDVLTSAVAGTAIILVENCYITVTNGYVFDLPNWAGGTLALISSTDASTNNGVINCTGGANALISGSFAGRGVGNTLTFSNGNLDIISTRVGCPVSVAGTGTITINEGSSLLGTLTTGGSVTTSMTNTKVSTGATQAITHSSSNTLTLADVNINTTNVPAVGGTGTLVLGSVTYIQESGYAGTLTVTRTTKFDAGDVECTNLEIDVPSGDPFMIFKIADADQFSFGVDDTDSDILKLTDGASPSAGTEFMTLDSSADGDIIFNPNGEGTFEIGDATQSPGAAGDVCRFFVGDTLVGHNQFYEFKNTDNTDPASTSELIITVGGSSGGDPLMVYRIGAVNNWSTGVDNSDSDKFKISYGAGGPSVGTNIEVFTTAGEITKPLQPSFLAYNSANDANQTGNGATATADFDTEIFDQGGDFSGDTFTAPVTGKYMLNTNLVFSNLAGANIGNALIVTSNRTYASGPLNWTAIKSSSNYAYAKVSALCDMDAADTATVAGSLSGQGANTVGFFGAAGPSVTTYFSGKLEC